ncbi:sigma-70 family RNA polymerase sigma factor [bacterium]|nr:sigma-70 family RNA polymerase sigma factor [bacterium]
MNADRGTDDEQGARDRAPDPAVTELLGRFRRGDRNALDDLVAALYRELRALASGHMRGERAGHTLQTTALVNEVYLKLSRAGHVELEDRNHFFAVAGRAMRQILVDHARARKRAKRGGDAVAIPFGDVEELLSEREADEIISLHDALERLARVNPRGCLVVEHRYFGGLTLDEVAVVLDISKSTVQRDWIAASSWLRKEVLADLS